MLCEAPLTKEKKEWHSNVPNEEYATWIAHAICFGDEMLHKLA